MPSSEIVIRGAREHNLRDINLRLPKNKLICMTGVSGSGKSSLAFDTLYAEGQRRYVESLSSYARQFLGQMPKPEVDAVSGLAPSISIQQKTSGRNPRSTVGTITEIYDYLRVLFARVGKGFCPNCDQPITAQTNEQIIEAILRLPAGTKFQILAPLIRRQKGEFRDLFDDLLKQGYLRARVDGEVVQLTDDLSLDRQMRHDIEVVIDRLTAGKTPRARLAEAVENALRLTGSSLLVSYEDGGSRIEDGTEESRRSRSVAQPSTLNPQLAPSEGETLFNTDYSCANCQLSFEPPSPQLFSFNSPLGMCMDCTGLGTRYEFVVERLIPKDKLSVQKGAIELLGKLSSVGRWRRHIYQGVAAAIEHDLNMEESEFLKTSWKDLPAEAQQLFLHGMGNRQITFSWRHRGGTWKHGGKWAGYIGELLEAYRKAKNPMRRRQLEKYMEVSECSSCNNSRLNAQARSVRITSTSFGNCGLRMTHQNGYPDCGLEEGEPKSVSRDPRSAEGSAEKPSTKKTQQAPNSKSSQSATLNPQPSTTSLSLPEVCNLSIGEAAEFFQSLDLDETSFAIAEEALKEIRGRLGFLLKCGLNYLALDRTAPTLSGGETQRIRLAGQIGCGLVGVVYILDEPSIGLHPRDNALLLESLQDLRDQGNTVIVVEHDEDTMRAADHIVDFGPGPGIRGGEVVVEGSLTKVKKSKRSLTGQFLSGKQEIAVPEVKDRREITKKAVTVKGAKHNNLNGVDVQFPLGAFICVTGVSGSGKSSLVNDILWQVLNRDVNKGNGKPGRHTRVNGLQHVDKAIDIDQSPIGRTPRSNPATYVKLFDEIRALYTSLPEARMRGYKPGRFSFNVPAGRCEACEGYGSKKLEMDFLADVWVTCEICGGNRFNRETLEVHHKGKSIAEVLDMDVQEALAHFENYPKINRLLSALHDVGLDYLKLGQPSPTLSGGEAQRIKLARELGKRSTGNTIYLLDEPTTGLHFADIQKLLEVLHNFVNDGNTVLVVEHNLDVIKTADWIIDLGPEGGAGGGNIVIEGTPETVAESPQSHTGHALRELPAFQSRMEDGGKRIEAESNGRNGHVNPQSAIRNPQSKSIVVRGAAQHNLQNLNLDIPRHKMNVFCGPSGSGKTSLAMDTLYAEGQRRYVESLSAYARQFLGQMPKPRVEHIHGLSPSIAIEQKNLGNTPRSTVGTVTEIYDYLRILFARLGTPYCPACNIPIETQTTDQVIDKLMAMKDGSRLLILAPQEVRVGQKYEQLWERLTSQGFRRVRINGETHKLEDVPTMDRRRKHEVDVVLDRVTIGKNNRGRVADSVEAALELGGGAIRVATVDDERDEPDWKTERFSLFYACGECGESYEELTPHNFSFNSHLGWCESCEGLGVQQGTNLSALIDNPHLSLNEAAVSAWPDPRENELFRHMLEAISQELQIPLDTPFNQLEAVQQRAILHGTGERWFDCEFQIADCGLEEEDIKTVSRDPKSAEGSAEKSSTKQTTKRQNSKSSQSKNPQSAIHNPQSFKFQFKGLYPAVEEASRVAYAYRQRLYALQGEVPCMACDGSRLREDAAAVRFQKKTLQQICELPLDDALKFLKTIKLNKTQKRIAGDLLAEATSRLSFLVEVGLEYLTLTRPLPTLSGGEMQRIRLAGQIGRALTGVLYVLDEPTIGLHPRDTGRLLGALKKLRNLGNTLVLVEHDREVLEASDRLFDFGPGAGRFGGTVTEEGTPKQVTKRKKSLTGEYLSDKKEIAVPTKRRVDCGLRIADCGLKEERGARREDGGSKEKKKAKPLRRSTLNPQPSTPTTQDWLELHGARHHNLRNVTLRIPLGTFTCVTGVSGSGKSTLVEHTLAKAISRKLHRSGDQPALHDKIVGLEHINKIITVDQQPLGNTPASNPATYTGVFEHMRQLFAQLPDAKVRGYRPGRFSFNRKGGRCEDCEGNGQKCIEMHFLPDVWIECETCRGKRYNQETLAVKYRGYSIAEVLEMPIGKAAEVFENIPKIRGYLETLCAIGLDYLTLGQPAPTLSGGEAQRVKLASELARPSTGRTLYVLDEPTTGLHFDDIAKLLKVLNSLVDLGNTVVVIEHNLDVIKTADWIVDLGPEAGAGGGWIVTEGTPEDVVAYAEGVQDCGLEKERGERMEDGGSKEKKKAKPLRRSTLNPQPSTLHRSYTGELLAPILASGTRAEREVFDAKTARKKRSGDTDLKQVGKSAKMPWEVDGRKWHTQDRLGHQGAPCRWDGAALAEVVDAIEADERFAAANWNHRSIVEMMADEKKGGWFLHALTGDEWLLKLKFRVKKRTFTQEKLNERLGLKPVDDIDEIPVYGRGDRVKISNLKGPWQEVQITVHGKADVDTPAFREFLDQARDGFTKQKDTKINPEDVMPWKVLGRKWHVMRKGMLKGKPKWKAEVLEQLFDLIDEVAPDNKPEWGRKVLVNFLKGGKPWVRIVTKRPKGIDLELFVKTGAITLGEIVDIGCDREIISTNAGESVVLQFRTQKDLKGLREFLEAHA